MTVAVIFILAAVALLLLGDTVVGAVRMRRRKRRDFKRGRTHG